MRRRDASAPRNFSRSLPDTSSEGGVPTWFALFAAAVVGFAFFLMELVWYRMLGPLLGGTVFTFGLILAVALFGIGVGGAAYGLLRLERFATLRGFAYTCLLEAFFIALAFALGDRVAVFALLLRGLGAIGFGGHVLAWSMVTALVVFPAAVVSGFQFPLLIALLGRGRTKVGRQIGLAYAWNTVGAIVGSLAGGFGLLPLLTAPGCWRLTALLLLALGLLSAILSWRLEPGRIRLIGPAVILVFVSLMTAATGPTAAWRHSPIGVGRVPPAFKRDPNGLRYWFSGVRRNIEWEAEGVESSVAIDNRAGIAFVLNGKNDGNAISDAPTQIMSGVLGALLHGAPRNAMVVGLGTGSTAGWLGVIPGMERVDVVELEPAVLEVARRCAAVNQNVLDNPRVHLYIGDAREALITTKRSYDVIFSEPSNPYRAGIASLFTREYYEAIADRLTERGIFIQWVQAYEVDAGLVRSVYATLSSVFPVVETWQSHDSDLLLFATQKPIRYDIQALRQRIRTEPFRTALANAWHTNELEGVFARYVGSPTLATEIAGQVQRPPNTDDRNYLEFAFALDISRSHRFTLQDVRSAAIALGAARPRISDGTLDWDRVAELRLGLLKGTSRGGPDDVSKEAEIRLKAREAYQSGHLTAALAAWTHQKKTPRGPFEVALVAEGLAEQGVEEATSLIKASPFLGPAESGVIEARLRLRQGNPTEATRLLSEAFERYREEPFALPIVVAHGFDLSRELVAQDPAHGSLLFQALHDPFALRAQNEARLSRLLEVAMDLDLNTYCERALETVEPNVPWRLDVLVFRRDCYLATGNPLSHKAEAELREFVRYEPVPFLEK